LRRSCGVDVTWETVAGVSAMFEVSAAAIAVTLVLVGGCG